MKKILLSAFCISVLLACLIGSPVLAASTGNRAHDMPAYYDGSIFQISFMELPAGGERATDQRNGSINRIYQYDPGLPGGAPFISVLDAIQGDGFNPLWEEFQIEFLTIPVQQFTSDNQILAAFDAGQINLIETDEVYICTVFKSKK